MDEHSSIHDILGVESPFPDETNAPSLFDKVVKREAELGRLDELYRCSLDDKDARRDSLILLRAHLELAENRAKEGIKRIQDNASYMLSLFVAVFSLVVVVSGAEIWTTLKASMDNSSPEDGALHVWFFFYLIMLTLMNSALTLRITLLSKQKPHSDLSDHHVLMNVLDRPSVELDYGLTVMGYERYRNQLDLYAEYHQMFREVKIGLMLAITTFTSLYWGFLDNPNFISFLKLCFGLIFLGMLYLGLKQQVLIWLDGRKDDSSETQQGNSEEKEEEKTDVEEVECTPEEENE